MTALIPRLRACLTVKPRLDLFGADEQHRRIRVTDLAQRAGHVGCVRRDDLIGDGIDAARLQLCEERVVLALPVGAVVRQHCDALEAFLSIAYFASVAS